MLVIRSSQMEPFELAMEEANVALVGAWIERSRPHLAPLLREGQVQEAIVEALRLGRALGLESVEAVGALLELRLAIGPGFEREPPIATLLRDESFPPDTRPGRVLALRSPEAWRQLLREPSPSRPPPSEESGP